MADHRKSAAATADATSVADGVMAQAEKDGVGDHWQRYEKSATKKPSGSRCVGGLRPENDAIFSSMASARFVAAGMCNARARAAALGLACDPVPALPAPASRRARRRASTTRCPTRWRRP